MPLPQPPYSRFAGARPSSDPTHDASYLQTLYNEDNSEMYRGELFLNEANDEIYYIDSTGVVRIFGERAPVPISRIDFSGIGEYADDAAAAAADPVVPVGGVYRTGSILKVRIA